MEEVPFAKFKRKRGAPVKYGPDKESSRKETARQRDATKVYLLSSHDEWRSAKQAYEKKLTKPITNGEFALHLLSVHRKSKCPTCTTFEKGEQGVLPLADTETQTTCKCSCSCNSGEAQDNKDAVPKPVRTTARKTQQGARRRKQSAPQGLHRDMPSDSESALLSLEGDGRQDGTSQAEESPGAISTTTRLLQQLQSSENDEEMDVLIEREEEDTGENEVFDYLNEDGDNGHTEDSDNEKRNDEMGEAPKATSPAVRYKDDEEDEDWKSSEMSDDSGDEDYGTHKSNSRRKPSIPRKKVPPKVVRQVPPRMVRKTSLKLVAKASRPRITMRLKTRVAPNDDAKEPAKRAPRGRRKNQEKEKKPAEDKPKMKARGQSVFLRRVSWAELEKRYQCKICNFESDAPLEAIRHLLADHPEMISALREFLLMNTVQRADEEKSLYSIALGQPLPLLMNQQGGEYLQGDSLPPHNPGELQDRGMEARIQQFTDMMMPGYIGPPPTLPHLAGMPSFQQSFNRPPLFDGCQNGMVPLPPHNLQAMTGATAALFGMSLPEGPMVPPNPYTSASNQEGGSTASPSPTTTHSSVVGMAQGGPHNGIQHGNYLHGANPFQMENTQRPDCARQTISQPQSPSQASPQIPHQLPRPSSQPPCLPTQMHPQAHSNSIQNLDLPQRPSPSHTNTAIHTDHQTKELSQSTTDVVEPPTDSSQHDPAVDETTGNGTGDLRDSQCAEEIPIVKTENEEVNSKEMPEDNPFEKEELLTLIERWVKIPLSCPHCNMKLPYMKRKDRHRCRRPSPNVLCDICGKSYPQTYFRFHYKRVHLPQNNVECQYCHREFRPSSISKHILERHKPFKPYRCGICGKEFNSKKHCDKHEAVHKTEKPHKCPTCGRGFTQRTNMKNHMRQHTGEQPYRCHNCAKSFTHNVSLKNHLKRYHGIDLWQLGHTGGGRPKKE